MKFQWGHYKYRSSQRWRQYR